MRSGRVLAFPDGISRYVTLSGWQWNVLDWLEKDAGIYASGEFAAESFNFAVRWCPGPVLRVLQPQGWKRRPFVAFNAAASPEPERESVLAFRSNGEQMTGGAHRHFEGLLHRSITVGLKPWMRHRMMGLSPSETANDRFDDDGNATAPPAS